MSEPKWTKGPWSVGGNTTVYNGTDTDGIRCWTREDAHLIASAPQLYQELENLISVLSSFGLDREYESLAIDMNDAREILAKARGETS